MSQVYQAGIKESMPPSSASRASLARILLVDDVAANLLALESILEPLGHVLVRASSGEEALRKLLKDDYALVLMDVRMPGLDGLQAAALMKQRSRSRRTPIILISGMSGDREDILHGYRQGAVDYLVKPIDGDVLSTKVSVFVDLYLKAHDIERQSATLIEQERAAEALRASVLAEQTARRIAEESERSYRIIGESIPQQVWAATADGKLDYVSAAVLRYFGRSMEQMLGDGWLGVVHHDDLADCAERWTRS
ncbi:MAG: response regulator, partial [Minicystis sp.]